MSKKKRWERPRAFEWTRGLLMVASLFLAAYFVTDVLLRAGIFLLLGLVFVLSRYFVPGRVTQMGQLVRDVESIADGNLQILKMIPESSGGMAHDFSVSLLVLNARLRHIVDKMKSVVDSVGHTSKQIVDLSRSLVKTGQNQSESSTVAAEAMAEINSAIIRIADAAESLNALGLTASSAAMQLTTSIEEVTRNTQEVGTFARDTQVSMEGMVRGMKEMEEASKMLTSASLDTDVAMANMHNRIREVAQKAIESDELAERATAAANTGSIVVSDVVQGMDKIAKAFETLGVVVGNLAQRSDQIGEILTVITQVADQTNLLSLNAAILSAQAGIHGRGFAVVADEIRKLSQRTSSSVQEIESLISSVRDEISEAVDLMAAGQSRVAEGLQSSTKASEALSEILNSTSTAKKRAEAIKEATQEQIHAETEVQRATATIKERLEQITGIIQLQTGVSNEVFTKADRTLDLMRNVERGMEEQTHGAKEVSSIVEHLSGIIQSIHRATSEQSVTSSQVVQSVESLKNAVQAGTATIRSLNLSALSLDQESFLLKHELSQFHLPQAQIGGSLKLKVTSSVSSLDPAYGRYVYLVDWIYSFYEGLLDFGEGTDIRPCLAEAWEISEDGLEYSFHLKHGVRFHNEKEMTAQDVRSSFLRVLHPESRSPGSWVFETIVGADEFMNGIVADVRGIMTPDPRTVRIRLREPVPFFLSMLAQCYAYIIPSELAEQHGPLREVCGTGPFRLDSFIPGQLIEMSRFEGYHDPPMPYLDQVSAQFSVPEQEIAEGMKEGTLHFSTELQGRYLEEFLSEPEWRPRIQTNVQLYTSLLALNCKVAPLNDVRVRQAIACAVDRERIVREVVGTENAVIARSLLPPGLPAYDPKSTGYLYDPARARSLLRQANVPDGTVLEMRQTEAGSNPALLEVMRENLGDVGIDLRIQYLEPDVLQNAIENHRVPVRLTKWVADYPDPDNFLYVPFHSKNPAIYTGFEDHEFDRIVAEARCLPDIRERIFLYQRAEQIWMEQCPCIVLFHNRALVLHQQSVQGCVPHFTIPVVRLKKVWLSS